MYYKIILRKTPGLGVAVSNMLLYDMAGARISLNNTNVVSHNYDTRNAAANLDQLLSVTPASPWQPYSTAEVTIILNIPAPIRRTKINNYDTDASYQAASIELYSSTDNVTYTLLDTVVPFRKDYEPNIIYANVKNSVANMLVGDAIKCGYVAASGVFGAFSNLGSTTSAFIPVASSATPSGSFYFIYVGDDFLGRKILIADRNIQHSISWDTLNSAGVSGGSGYPEKYDKGNRKPFINVTTSLIVGTGSPSELVNGDRTDTTFYVSNQTVAGLYLRFKLLAPQIFTGGTWYQGDTTAMGTWKWQGSNDGTTWTDIGASFNLGGTASGQSMTTLSGNTTAYQFYQMLGVSGNASAAPWLNEMEFTGTNLSSNKTIRLLTGGVSSTDTNNEWDKYVVNSTLNGTITAGDDNVWHWSSGYNLTSTTNTTGASTRTARGASTANNNASATSSSVQTNIMYRPVLVATVFIATNKYLVNDGGTVKAYNAGWVSLGAYPPSEATYRASGFTDLTLLTDAVLRQLTSPNPTLLFYTDNPAVTSRINRLTAVPPAKFIKPLGDIDLTNAQAVTAVNLTASVNGGGVVKVVVSVDSGVTWKTWNGSGWIVVDTSNIANVANNGMTPAVLNARVLADWNSVIGNARVIRFAYYLSMAATTDSAATDLITLTMDMLGSWNKATHNTDYTYGYIRNDTIRFTLSANGDYKINY